MKLMKILLSSMFVFTAVIKTAYVGKCGTESRRYDGINVYFNVVNDDGTLVTHSQQCGANWPDIENGIRFQLQQIKIALVADELELNEHKRLVKEAKELVGAEVRGE